jgi:hypothetical protein
MRRKSLVNIPNTTSDVLEQSDADLIRRCMPVVAEGGKLGGEVSLWIESGNVLC